MFGNVQNWFIFRQNKKLSLNQNVWRDHATVHQDVLLHFRVIFLHQNQAEIWKKYSVVQLYSFFIVYLYEKQKSCLSALELFHCLYPHFFVVYPCGKQWGNMEKSYKMQQDKFQCSYNFTYPTLIIHNRSHANVYS
jgi:hypothetical protein